MISKPFHITTVLFDPEGPLAAVADGRWEPHAAAQRMVATLRARGVAVGATGRHARKALLEFMGKAFQMRPADIRPCISLRAPRSSGRRRNPFQTAAERTGTAPQRYMVVSADRDVLALAKEAGSVSVEWCAKGPPGSPTAETDYRAGNLHQLNRLDLLIEDELHVAVATAAVAVPVLLCDRPWNRGGLPSGVTRVGSWDQVLRLVEGTAEARVRRPDILQG